MRPAVRLRFAGLTKRFAAHVALHPLDLEVEPGECLVLLGPSGCGKTTLLRMIAGLEVPDAGRLWIGEREATRLAPAERDVAMVFQNYALYPHMSVEGNIGFPLQVRGVPAGERARRVREVAAHLGLEPLLARRPAQLSGGQQQRVALARAIVRNPAVYLMDEPLSNLDAQLRTRTRAELKRLQQELGTTTIYVTHDQGEAMTLGHRVALMHDGRVVQLACPLELYARPANTFVATFLGNPAMNLLPARIEQGRLLVGGVAVEGRPRAAEGAAVTVGVRPEDLTLADAPRDGWAEATVAVVEPLGNETLVTIERPDLRLVARTQGAPGVSAGARAWFRIAPETVTFFDAQTGSRLD